MALEQQKTAAREIVRLQRMLSHRLERRLRIALQSKQRKLWDSALPGAPYDKIAQLASA